MINLYNLVALSGNTTILKEGSYTQISLPKDKFSKPKESDVNTLFDTFKDLSIYETETDYIIKTSYKTLAGGYNAATPLNVSLIPRQTANQSETTIKQEFYNAEGNKLSESFLQVQGKGEIENPSSTTYRSVNIKEKVNEEFIVNAGTNYSFPPNYVNTPTYNYNDPRDRRVSVKIPEGLTLINPDNTWTYDDETDSYYKDIKRDQVSSQSLTATVDLGGLDLSDYPSSSNTKEIKLDYTLSVVENGIIKTDIAPKTWNSRRTFYAPKEAPSSPGAYASINTTRSQTLIDGRYKTLSTDRSVYLPYDESLLSNFRMKFFHRAISYFSFNNSKDENDPKLLIASTQTDVTGYTYPSEIRLNLQTSGLTEEEITNFTAKVEGTKAYGIKYDGSKVLLTDSVPVGFNGEGEYFKFQGSDYKTIEFEYPSGGVLLNDKAEVDKFKYVLATDVIADFREQAVQDLKSKLENNQTPSLSYSENAKGLSSYDDRSRTNYEITYKKLSTDNESATNKSTVSADTDTNKYLNYNEIRRSNCVSVSNGSFFYVGDTVKTYLSYTHTRNGDSFPSINPENANLYYLVPDGLEPIENPEIFSQMRIIRGYQEGYNLVIAKPAETKIPTGTSVVSSMQNNYTLEFKVSNRLDIGSYKIYAGLAIDNNKVEVVDQMQYGILQFDNPSGIWQGITNSVDNRSEIPNRFTDLCSTSFTVYPPLVLSAYKEVKLRTDADSKYASALGTRAKIGDEIDYRWYFKNNSTKAIEKLTIIDVLPYKGDKSIVANQAGEYPSRGSKFTTPLQSIESHEKFDFYYSTDAVKDTLEANKKANWQSNIDDFSKVTMIKAVLKTGQKINVGETCTIVTHNKIEDNPRIEDQDKAFNSFAYSLNEGATFTEALKVEVSVSYPKKDILIKKVNANNENITIADTVFDLYSHENNLLKVGLKTNRNGELILRDLFVGKTYYLEEKSVPFPYQLDKEKIEFTVSDSEKEQIIIVKNDVKRIDIPVTKAWENDNNQNNNRPENIKVKLFADGIETEKTLTLSESNNWTDSFKGLEEYKEGNKINYTVQEVGVEDNSIKLNGNWYKVKVEGSMKDGFIITNTKQDSWTPMIPPTRNVKVEKEWLGSDGKAMKAPVESIEVELYKDGEATGKKETLNADKDWKATFKDLPQTSDLDGKLVSYTIKEVGAVDNEIKFFENLYKVSITGSMKTGFKITNQRQDTPNNPNNPTEPEKETKPDKIDISGYKTWEDNNNKEGRRPDQIIIRLYADGIEVDKKIVTESNGWKWTFENLDMDNKGKEIKYTISEDKVEGYTSKVDGYNVTNKIVPKIIYDLQKQIPKTGIMRTINYIPLFGLALFLLLARKIEKKKKTDR